MGANIQSFYKDMHDTFYLYLFREEIENKSLMRFGKTHVPQVNLRLANSRFSLLRQTIDQARFNFVVLQLGKPSLKGVGHFLDVPTVVQEFPEFLIISCSPRDLSTPAVLQHLVLPDVPDPNKGAIISQCEEQWLTAHLVVEYSKVSKWVALEYEDFAVVVFTMDDENFPLGRIIEL